MKNEFTGKTKNISIATLIELTAIIALMLYSALAIKNEALPTQRNTEINSFDPADRMPLKNNIVLSAY